MAQKPITLGAWAAEISSLSSVLLELVLISNTAERNSSFYEVLLYLRTTRQNFLHHCWKEAHIVIWNLTFSCRWALHWAGGWKKDRVVIETHLCRDCVVCCLSILSIHGSVNWLVKRYWYGFFFSFFFSKVMFFLFCSSYLIRSCYFTFQEIIWCNSLCHFCMSKIRCLREWGHLD